MLKSDQTDICYHRSGDIVSYISGISFSLLLSLARTQIVAQKSTKDTNAAFILNQYITTEVNGGQPNQQSAALTKTVRYLLAVTAVSC